MGQDNFMAERDAALKFALEVQSEAAEEAKKIPGWMAKEDVNKHGKEVGSGNTPASPHQTPLLLPL